MISCHDFRADSEGDERFRTRDLLESELKARGFQVTRRPDVPQPWLRDYLYVARRR